MTGLEANLGTTTVTVKKTGGSVEHPTCYDYSKYYLRKFKGGLYCGGHIAVTYGGEL